MMNLQSLFYSIRFAMRAIESSFCESAAAWIQMFRSNWLMIVLQAGEPKDWSSRVSTSCLGLGPILLVGLCLASQTPWTDFRLLLHLPWLQLQWAHISLPLVVRSAQAIEYLPYMVRSCCESSSLFQTVALFNGSAVTRPDLSLATHRSTRSFCAPQGCA